MSASINQDDDFEPDDFEVEQTDDFQADDFVADEKPKEKSKVLQGAKKLFDIASNPLTGFIPDEVKENVAKGVLSGASFGYSEKIPGLKPEEGLTSEASKVVGSALPIGGLTKVIGAPIMKLASKSSYFKKGAEALGHLLTAAGVGGTYGTIEETSKGEGFKAPSVDDFVEHASTWATIDAGLQVLGLGGRFAKALGKWALGKGVDKTEALKLIADQVGAQSGTDEQIAKKALEILEGKPFESSEQLLDKEVLSKTKDLKSRKIDSKDFTKLEQAPPEPYLPESFDAENIAEEMIDSDVDRAIENIAPKAESSKQFGEQLVEDINNVNESNEKAYDQLYEKANSNIQNKKVKADETVGSIFKQIQKIEEGNLKTIPAGLEKVKTELFSIMEDLGFKGVIDEAGNLVNTVKEADVPLSKAIELKRRINKLINYDLLEGGYQDLLKDPANKLRESIRKGYGSKTSEARKAFEEAEKRFGENAERMGRKSIRGARTSEKPESLIKVIRTPSGYADMVSVVSPEMRKQIDRELLDHMKSLSEDRARQFYRELRPQLSADTRAVAEQILESKVPKVGPGRKELQRSKIQEGVIEDLSRATITGERPDKALKLWKTQEGQQLIKASLENNPNKKEVIKYLSDQSFKDFVSSFVSPEGKIDFKKLNALVKDPTTAKNIEMVGGKEALDFFRNLEQLSNRVEKNLKIIEDKIGKGTAKERKEVQQILESRGKERFKKTREAKEEAVKLAEQAEKDKLLYKFDDLLNSYGFKAKGLLAALGIFKLGAPTAAALGITYEVVMRVAKSKEARDALRKAATSGKENPKALINAIDVFANQADD